MPKTINAPDLRARLLQIASVVRDEPKQDRPRLFIARLSGSLQALDPELSSALWRDVLGHEDAEG